MKKDIKTIKSVWDENYNMLNEEYIKRSNTRLYEAEKWISDLEDNVAEPTQLE